MREALGWDVTAPEMPLLGWSIAKQTDHLLMYIDKGQYDLVAGSSMGGLAAANASSLRPNAEFRLLLIAPAFGLADHWDGMEDSGRRAWKLTNQRRYKGFKHDIMLPWEFMESAEEMSWPIPKHKTTIIHGIHDEIVPIRCSRKIAEMCDFVELVEIDDHHRMKKSLEMLPSVVSGLMSR